RPDADLRGAAARSPGRRLAPRRVLTRSARILRRLSMHVAFLIVQMLLSIVLIVAILLQARGSGFSAFGSSDSSIYRTRRGFVCALVQFTIVLAVCWVLVSIGATLTF